MLKLVRLVVIGIAPLALLGFMSPTIVSAQELSDNLLLSVVPHRTAEEIRADLDHANVTAKLAQERLSKAQTAYATVQARIKAKKQELGEIDQKIKAAKNTDNKAQIIAVEASKNAAKQVLDLLESRKDLRSAEVDAADAANELANSSRFVLELELELSLGRVEQESLLTSLSTALTVSAKSQTVRTIEGKCLEAQQVEAKKTEQLASKEKQVIEQRLKLFDLQSKVLGNKR